LKVDRGGNKTAILYSHDRADPIGHTTKVDVGVASIDAEGVLAYAGAIDDDARGSAESPTNHVAAAVAALRAGERPDPSSTQPYGCTVKYE
jgi:hypothetical protein